MRVRLLILLSIFLSLPLFYSLSNHAKAFDFFSNCTTITHNDGTTDKVCGPCKDNPQAPTCKDANTTGTDNPIAGQNGIINKGATVIALIAGIGAVIMIILGALSIITSGGNTEAAKKGRQQITSALIGIVIIALSWSLVRLVSDRVIG